MPVKIIRGDRWEILGKGAVLLSCPPVIGAHPGLYTGMIVEEAALLSKAHALIQKERKAGDTIDESVVLDFDAGKLAFANDFGVKLELAIKGIDDPGLEIQTTQQNNPIGVVELAKKVFDGLNLRTSTAETLSENSPKDLQTAWLSLGPDEREFQKEQVVSRIADLVGSLNVALGSSQGDEGVSGVLD